MSESTYQRLTAKQRRFVDAYLGAANGNATAAAKQAGYSERSARQVGHENLTKPDIQGAIRERLAESAMAADEVLARLTEHAQARYADFITIVERKIYHDGEEIDTVTELGLDLEALKAAGLLRLVKGLGRDRHGNQVIQFYDAQHALELLGRHHRLFVDRQEITGPDGGPVPLEILEAANRAYGDSGEDPSNSA